MGPVQWSISIYTVRMKVKSLSLINLNIESFYLKVGVLFKFRNSLKKAELRNNRLYRKRLHIY